MLCKYLCKFYRATISICVWYYKKYEANVTRNTPHDTQTAIGILESIKLEFEKGWITSLKGLVAEEFFSDLIEMSEYFIEEGYKDPAAVMTGCVLEEHLRQLCELKRN